MVRVSPSAFTTEVKELILRRAQFRCDRCGMRAHSGHFHHRTPRRAGGSSRTDLGLPSNGLLLHPQCHDFVERKRRVSAQLGFLVGYGSLPSDVPVYLWSGWHYLTDDGGLIKINGVPPLHPVAPTTESEQEPASTGCDAPEEGP
jgi:HNH endonuclease